MFIIYRFIYIFFYDFVIFFCFFFFFQAEDGIRDGTVTGVQTCALPIYQCGRWDHDGRADTGWYDIEDFARKSKRPTGDKDRKSTRLNSSHSSISYAVFCLKKKRSKGASAGCCTEPAKRRTCSSPPGSRP